MKNKGLYITCRVLNWVLPLFLLFGLAALYVVITGPDNSKISNYYGALAAHVMIMYAIYGIARITWRRTRSRWLYETVIFVFAGIAIYNIISNDFWIYNWLDDSGTVDAGLGDKIMGIVSFVLIIFSKIVTLNYQTEKYRANADNRRKRLLDEKILSTKSGEKFWNDRIELGQAVGDQPWKGIKRERRKRERLLKEKKKLEEGRRHGE